ncbi:MAG: hypothetical protein U0Y68_13990 [Blastocatellia bacterium]
MSPQRWQQVRQLFENALEHPAAERPALLAEACGADDELRREVEEMLAASDTVSDFLEAPPRQWDVEGMEERQPPCCGLPQAGRGTGPLRNHRAAGARRDGRSLSGARSTTASPGGAQSLACRLYPRPARVRRFAQEAQAALALNHPNIAMIFDLGQADCGHFIAMELVEGQTLRTVLRSAKLSLPAVLEINVADCQRVGRCTSGWRRASGHQAGKHYAATRWLREGARFRVGKLTEARRADQLSGLTRTTGTAPGTVMGTISYLSPEQVRGQEGDGCTHRSLQSGRRVVRIGDGAIALRRRDAQRCAGGDFEK